MKDFSPFTTPEAQARRDRIINTPSWAAFVFNFVYLAAMRAWRHALIAVVVIVGGIWLVRMGTSGRPLASVLIAGNWFVVGLMGRRIAWQARPWQSLDDFLRCQQAWDRWGRVVALLLLAVATLVGSGVVGRKEPRAKAVFPLEVALLSGFALRWLLRQLAPHSVRRGAIMRGVLIVGWLFLYAVLVAAASFALHLLGLNAWSGAGPFALAWFAGTLTFAVRLMRWKSQAPPAGPPAAMMPKLSIQRVAHLAAEAVEISFRRPLTLLPPLFAVAIRYTIGLIMSNPMAPSETLAAPSLYDVFAAVVFKPLAMYLLLDAPLFLLAAAATTEMVAQHELGQAMSLRTSVFRAISRLPVGLVALWLEALGTFVGFALLIIPGIAVTLRWIFVSHAVLLARENPLKAFRTSAEVTAGHGWGIAWLLIFIVLGGAALQQLAPLIPSAGKYLMWWLDFSWGTVATALVYLRLGGPIHGIPHRAAG